MREVTFIKYHGTDVLRDWQRVNLLFRYASDIQGLMAPKPISLNEHNQTITYEYIDGIIPSFQALDKNIDKAIMLGHSLAKFHHESQNNSRQYNQQQILSFFGLTEKEIDTVIHQLPLAFFIGDAWHGNIFFHQNNCIILLDPLPNQSFFSILQSSNYASSLLDISTLYMSFFVCHSLFNYLRLNKIQVRNMADKVIESYLEYYNSPGLIPLIRKVSQRIALIHVREFQNRIAWPFGQIKSICGFNIIKIM